MNDVECPYCEVPQEIDHDDGYGYQEDETYEQRCNHCKKLFVYTTSITYYYSAEKADCLNGSEHNFIPTVTCPKEATKMRCSLCDEHREPTAEELEIIMKS